jgi:hypothetical protein
MSANILVPNDYYTIYCKKLVVADAPVQSAETWCYYPSNPAGNGQQINNVLVQAYPMEYNVSAISKNVVVNVDGSIDIIQEGIYRLEIYANMLAQAQVINTSMVVRLDGAVIFQSAVVGLPIAGNPTPQSYLNNVFFNIPKGNTVAKKLAVFVNISAANPGGTLNITSGSLSLQRIDEAPTPP